MAMELACGRSCAVAAFGASSSRMRAPVSSRPQRVTPGRVSRRVRAGEDVGTEQAEKLSVKAETEEKSSSSNNGSTTGNSSTPFPTGRKYTGYVEKDTAGQTNIYAVEPTVYVSESVFSSGEAGSTSAEEASNSVAVAFGLGLVAVASAASILFTVGKNAPVTTTAAVGYNGPPLSYYISKFSPAVPVEGAITVEDSVSAPSVSEEPVTEGTSVDEA